MCSITKEEEEGSVDTTWTRICSSSNISEAVDISVMAEGSACTFDSADEGGVCFALFSNEFRGVFGKGKTRAESRDSVMLQFPALFGISL
mmetsp:Transcript_26334/g.55990  ORF Transcript_26334/g.55990 Transcript_26334/m.55990 type:complete len:90 (-) Transcript_26334:131-400(-)